jgi:hypothetical protein
MPFQMGIMPGEHDWMEKLGGIFGSGGMPMGGGMGGGTPTPAPQPPGRYGSVMSKIDAGLMRMGMPAGSLPQLGMHLLANSRGAPGQPGPGLGQALGTSVIGMQEQNQQKTDSELRRQYLQAQIEKMQQPEKETPRTPIVVKDPVTGQLRYEDPSKAVGMEPGSIGGAGSGLPSALVEWEAFQKMSPEQQKQFLNMKRQPAAPQLSVINGVPTLVDRISGNINPLSTLGGEVGAATDLAAGKARGGLIGEAQGGIDKKGLQAPNVLATLTQAEPLIDIATGSATGAAVDKGAAFFGKSTDGANATAQLKVIQAKLMTEMPRMEGPQSDRDVELYREAAGQLGDPTVPREQKKAAIKAIREINQKYVEGAGGPKAPTQYSEGQTATNPKTGEKMVYKGGKWVKQ